jgi:hypothetical protein
MLRAYKTNIKVIRQSSFYFKQFIYHNSVFLFLINFFFRDGLKNKALKSLMCAFYKLKLFLYYKKYFR